MERSTAQETERFRQEKEELDVSVKKLTDQILKEKVKRKICVMMLNCKWKKKYRYMHTYTCEYE